MPASMFEGGGISKPPRRSGGGRFPGKSTTKAPSRGSSGGRRGGGGRFAGRSTTTTPTRGNTGTRRGGGGSFGGGSLTKGSGSSGYGGRGSGGGYRGGFGSSSTGGMSTLAAAPSINDYLGGDDTYQAQVAAINKALTNYKSQMGERQGEYNADFTNRLNELNKGEERATTEQTDDYAGRGLFISGLYGKARGDLEEDYNRREGDMNTAKTSFMNGLDRDLLNYTEEQGLTKDKARMDAINRRAAQYGIVG